MRIQKKAGIGAALLVGVIFATAQAQTAKGNPQKNGNNQATGTDAQRKSGQVVHQDFSKAQANKPENPSAPPNQGGTQGPTGSGNANSKTKFRQEFGPTQANKKNDAIAPSDSDGKAGKTKTGGAKTQSPN